MSAQYLHRYRRLLQTQWETVLNNLLHPVSLYLFVHGLLILWATINSFTHYGCLESQLLCPVTRVAPPGSAWRSSGFNDIWLYLTVIAVSSFNIAQITFQTRVEHHNRIITLLITALFVFSVFFTESKIELESTLLQQLRQSGIE